MTLSLKTLHAPAEREDSDKVKRQAQLFEEYQILKQAFDASNAMIIVINRQRQIIYANWVLLGFLGLESSRPIVGKRPGEVIGCLHAQEGEGGCGTAQACRSCNTVNFVLQSIDSRGSVSGEAFLTSRSKEAETPFEFLEKITPFTVKGEEFYVISLVDISDTKRRRQLERVFFHDLLNTSGALSGLITLLKEEVPDSLRSDMEFVENGFTNMVDEIVFHKKLIDAENGELNCDFMSINSRDILECIFRLYMGHDVARNKNIVICTESEELEFKSDYMLLGKVLGNMIKNALEATDTGGTVTLGCRKVEFGGQFVEFWVHNHQFIPLDVQQQVFLRSFSTKGNGRGLGTYSIKLFAESYLGGKVQFVTDEVKGTTFLLRLPL